MTVQTLSSSFVSVVTVIDANNLGIVDQLPKLQAKLQGLYADYEIILVAKKNAERPISQQMTRVLEITPSIRWIQLSNNVSDEVALAAGLESAIGDFVVLMDLQKDSIALVKDAVDKCKSGIDVVVGTARQATSFGYSLLRPLASFLLKKIDYQLPRNSTHFRCLSRRATNAIISSGKFHNELFMQIQKTGYEFAELSYQQVNDEPKQLYTGMCKLMHLMVFNSTVPLRVMSLVAIVVSGLACLFSVCVIILRFLRNDIVGGWASTVFLVSMFSFLQFIILSFINEYLGRFLHEQQHQDAYHVVFEKNSLTMVNHDRINVLNFSVNKDDQNLVQTGRNR